MPVFSFIPAAVNLGLQVYQNAVEPDPAILDITDFNEKVTEARKERNRQILTISAAAAAAGVTAFLAYRNREKAPVLSWSIIYLSIILFVLFAWNVTGGNRPPVPIQAARNTGPNYDPLKYGPANTWRYVYQNGNIIWTGPPDTQPKTTSGNNAGPRQSTLKF